MADQAWADNAVITYDDGMMVKFRPRCPYCGHVNLTLEMNGSATKGNRSGRSCFCPECRNTFNITISRG